MQPEENRIATAARPLRRLAVILYASLGLLLLAMPQQIADRLDDFEPNPVAHAAKLAAEAVAKVMAPLGIPQLFGRARKAFLEALGERN